MFIFVFNKTMSIFALTISRGGAVVARWAHNPKVIGSNPVSATEKRKNHNFVVLFCLPQELNVKNSYFNNPIDTIIFSIVLSPTTSLLIVVLLPSLSLMI